MSRGLMVLLALSMTANVGLGFIAGRHLASPSPPPGPPPAFARGFGMRLTPDLEALSPEARAAFRRVFDERRDTLKHNHHETRRLRNELSRALAADQWSRTEVDAAVAALRSAESAQQAAMSQLIVEAFEGLSAADRKALVEAMDKRREHVGRFRLRGSEADAHAPRRPGPNGHGDGRPGPHPDEQPPAWPEE